MEFGSEYLPLPSRTGTFQGDAVGMLARILEPFEFRDITDVGDGDHNCGACADDGDALTSTAHEIETW